jgi:ubiquinol-cytochrome c reductase cytochrome b subunit
MVFYGVLWMAAGADTIAVRFHVTFEGVLHTFQVLVLLGPVIGFLVTRSLCLALQDREREIAEEGAETGVIIRTAEGGYRETHRVPLEPSARRSALLDRGAEPAKDPVGVGTERVVVD